MFYPKSTDVIGYVWQADKHCLDCIRDIAIAQAQKLGSATMWGDCGSAEDALGEWASLAGIDPSEADTNEYPAPIFADAVGDTCGCGWDIGG